MAKRTVEQRFWSKVDKAGECWLWTAGKDGDGYGRFNGRGAHRVSYELEVGPIPKGLELDHLCRVPACVRPDHLEPVTHRENMARGVSFASAALATHCKQGHEFTPENTYLKPAHERGTRRCLACIRARDKARSQRSSSNLL